MPGLSYRNLVGQLVPLVAPEPRRHPSRPALILCHGGWQGPEAFSLLIPLLETAGYTVFALSLPSSGTVPALPNFEEDVKVVRSAVNSTLETGKDVVIVMHSYGGVVGCEALKDIEGRKITSAPRGMQNINEPSREIRGKILKLVFLSALLLPVGGRTWNPERGIESVAGFECTDELIAILDGPRRFFNDLPLEEALRWNSKMKLQSRFAHGRAFTSKLTYPAYRHFPCSYLFCTLDNAIPLKIQKQMVAFAGITETSTLDAGHAAHISQPKFVSRFIRQSAGEWFPSL